MEAAVERYIEYISIHALRKEGDWSGSIRWAQRSHFYPRPPQGGRPLIVLSPIKHSCISIHALRKEGDRGPPR